MNPESIKSLTPEAMAALHDVDPELATEFVKRFLGKNLLDPLAMANLNASGLLGRPGQMWCLETRSRIDSFVTFACSDGDFNRGFERGSSTEDLIKAWLNAARPTPEDMSYLLFLGDNDNFALKEYFIEMGADPHLPIVRSLENPDAGGKESYAMILMGISDDISPHLRRILTEPADDIPIASIAISQDPDVACRRTLLDVALTSEDYESYQVLLDARDIHSPKVTQRMTDSLSRAISEDRNFLALQLIGVGAEPAGVNWDEVVSYFSTKKPGAQEPRIMDDFLVVSSDWRHLMYNGRRLIHLALERLVEHGLNIDICDDLGRGMVYYCAHNGHMSMLETLLGLGADYQGVLASYDSEKRGDFGAPDDDDREPSEQGRRMLLAKAARDAVSGVVNQAKANLK